MANNVTGIFLRKEVEELRKKGEDWGLSKEQIDEAILRALGGTICNLPLYLYNIWNGLYPLFFFKRFLTLNFREHYGKQANFSLEIMKKK